MIQLDVQVLLILFSFRRVRARWKRALFRRERWSFRKMLVPFSVFRFLMISVLLSLDKNWMMIGVVPSLRLGRSWMAVISISGMSTWSLSWVNAMTFLFMMADSCMVLSAGESEDDVGWVWAQ